MSARITLANLEAIVKRINMMTNSPLEPYTKLKNGKFVANIGNYHLDGAYGGYALHRMDNKGGGVQDVLRVGHVSKPDLYYQLHSFIAGLEAANA